MDTQKNAIEPIRFRNLRPNEIQCRVRRIEADQNGANYVSLMLYKDARVDQNILDETVGPERWQKNYSEKCGQLFCIISIKMDNGEWISKEDTGSKDNNFEPEKSVASDAQKRAGYLWGIGRALYTKLDIEFYLNKDEAFYSNRAGCLILQKGVRFYVSDIGYSEDNTKITRLKIVDQSGRTRFEYPYTGNK